MDKIKRLIIFSIICCLFFINPLDILAKVDCTKYSCISCEAAISKNLTVVWNVKSDGEGYGTVEIEKKKDKLNYKITNKFTYANFVSKDKKELKCPTSIYKYESYNTPSRQNLITLSPKKGAKFTKTKSAVKKTKDNKKPLLKDDNLSSKSCRYSGRKHDGTPANVEAIITKYSNGNVTYQFSNGYKLSPNSEDIGNLINLDDDKCPKLFVYCGSSGSDSFCTVTTDANFTDSSHGNNEGTEGDKVEDADDLQNGDNTINKVDIDPTGKIECEAIFIFEEGHLGWLLQKILDYIKIIGPIIVIILSALDFIKAIMSSDEKAMKQAQSKLIIRLCAALALFLIPTLVELALHLVNNISDPTCGFK